MKTHIDSDNKLKKLNLEQKASLLSGSDFWHLQGIPEHDIPPIKVSDGPHGLRTQTDEVDHLGMAQSVPATCFPTAATMACSWDTALLRTVGEYIADEARQAGVSVVLGPGINIKRHPLCGRNFEYFSEDPVISGDLAASFIEGVQSKGVGTSLKHFAVNNQEYYRLVVDAVVDERTLRELYLAGFERAVTTAQPWTVMCSYNRINGVYACENSWLLRTVLKDEWGHQGLVVTDWGAMNDRPESVRASLELEMPGNGGINDARVVEAVHRGELDEALVDEAAERILQLTERGRQVHEEEGFRYDAHEHHAFAQHVAEASMVLLKNSDEILPLQEASAVTVIGDMAKHPRYQGAGSSQIEPTQLDTFYDCLSQQLGRVIPYARGYDPGTEKSDPVLVQEAIDLARESEFALVFAGLPSILESEGFDRDHMHIPANQNELIQALIDQGSTVIVVLSNGAPVTMPWIDGVAAVLEGYLGGQAGAGAAVNLLYGRANPRGKLAETFPLQQTDVPSDAFFPGSPDQVQYREGLYVGYRYFNSAQIPVLFPFGFGLSYTTFTYSDLRIDQGDSDIDARRLRNGDRLTVRFSVSNTGARSGTEVVQLYVQDKTSTHYRPYHELKGFAAVDLQPGETKTVELALDYRSFAFWDVNSQDWQIETGEFTVQIGASSRDIRLKQNIQVVSDFRPAIPAKIRHMLTPYYEPNFPLAIDDTAFSALLGDVIPAPLPERPFHINSTLSHVSRTWTGRRLVGRVMKRFKKEFTVADDPTLQRMMERMIMDSPLRALALLSGGKVSMNTIEGMVALLNHRYIRALQAFRK